MKISGRNHMELISLASNQKLIDFFFAFQIKRVRKLKILIKYIQIWFKPVQGVQ